jgi:hypothetical protein
LIPGEIESSNYFKERRGSRKRRRNITGYQISVKFYDSGIEKIKKFEVKNQLDEGVKVNLYHVPNTDISSLDKDSAGGSFWLLFGSLGMMGFFGYSVFAIFTRKETN